jgi:hypothetical protein
MMFPVSKNYRLNPAVKLRHVQYANDQERSQRSQSQVVGILVFHVLRNP